ncbi:uncharacterized protein LOC130733465 isoform X2 [Lotus japonicus]|uniref:uncharacterized protein LOC130733465 isoform X2 n=1 Tax=Lotus japonicus TaxID=34305 RepID=UPI002583AACC|nr:uncharacterized protein LOC130733465 isoform X2 [Lotus japonicus]XP_057441664.1 uncharacterized protein LOC130733465 isoform X2 [Lotus japonicus]
MFTRSIAMAVHSTSTLYLVLCLSSTVLLLLSSSHAQAQSLKYCDKNADYAVKVSGVEILPDPVVRGVPFTFKIAAYTGEPIPSGDLLYEISYAGIEGEPATFLHDLCEEAPCPVPAGHFKLVHTELLPSVTPPLSLSLSLSLENLLVLTVVSRAHRSGACGGAQGGARWCCGGARSSSGGAQGRDQRVARIEENSRRIEEQRAMSKSNSLPMILPTLDGKNYDHWSVQMKAIFGFQECLEVVESGFEEITESSSETQKSAHSEAKKKDCKATFLIHQCVDVANFEKISKAKSSKEACEILEKSHSGLAKVKKVRLQTMRRQYELLQMEEQESIAEYFTRIRSLTNQMKTYGESMPDQGIVEKLTKVSEREEHSGYSM